MKVNKGSGSFLEFVTGRAGYAQLHGGLAFTNIDFLFSSISILLAWVDGQA